MYKIKNLNLQTLLSHKLKILAVILVIGCISLVSCIPSARVKKATAWDWVWGLEEMESGAVRVWFRHDNIAGYCTGDPELVKQLQELGGMPVEFNFETKDWADEESPNFFGTAGCSNLSTGSESSTPIFKITAVKHAPHMGDGR